MNDQRYLVTNIPIVEEVLDHHSSTLGRDLIAYRNHVHRVVNLCLALTHGSRDDFNKIAVASAFHDLGIWTDHTFDYLAPSISLAREYLVARSRADWISVVGKTHPMRFGGLDVLVNPWTPPGEVLAVEAEIASQMHPRGAA